MTANDSSHEYLTSKGWIIEEPKLDPLYILELIRTKPQRIFELITIYLYNLSGLTLNPHRSIITNILSLFHKDVQTVYLEFLWGLARPEPTLNHRSSYNFKAIIYNNARGKDISPKIINLMDRPINLAMEELENTILLRILDDLGPPYYVSQTVITNESIRCYQLPQNSFTSWQDIPILGSMVYAHWGQPSPILLVTEKSSDQSQCELFDDNPTRLNALISKHIKYLATIINGYSHIVGNFTSTYRLDSFHPSTYALTSLAIDKVDSIPSTGGKVNILLTGVSGTGKSSWADAFAHEVLCPQGYLVFILDYESLMSFIPPAFCSNICIIVNDADNLVHNRSEALDSISSANTQRILAWLDGSIFTTVTPLKKDIKHKVVTILTCNTTERWDTAALRKGRIDIPYTFTHIIDSINDVDL